MPHFGCPPSFRLLSFLCTVQKKTVIIIAGPTAVGKTSVAIDVAKRLQTEIISADSRQCYKELSIGVARPSPSELAAVPHHFIASHSINEKITAATFENFALSKTDALFQTHSTVVLVGGTGLYIKAFCEGFDAVPDVPEDLHQRVIADYNEKGLDWLQEEIKKADPLFWNNGETQNPQRLMRALEVVRAAGQSILQYQKGEKKVRDFIVRKYALQLPKDALHQNINLRVDRMMEEGLLKEVRSLVPHQHLNALQTVGYTELFAHLRGELSLGQAVEAIKQSTRKYAKRQLTWFKKDEAFEWLSPMDAAQQIIESTKAGSG